jgi:hypothetical protein
VVFDKPPREVVGSDDGVVVDRYVTPSLPIASDRGGLGIPNSIFKFSKSRSVAGLSSTAIGIG